MQDEQQAGAARRDRRGPGRVAAVLAVAGLALTASACSGSSSGASGPASSVPATSAAPSSTGTAGTSSPEPAANGPHASPAAVVTGFYQDVAKGDFAGACSLLDPAVIPQLLLRFGSCQLALEQHYTPAARAGLQDVRVDQSKVSVVGDGAFVPKEAITFGGKPSRDGDQQAVRNNGKWFLSSPAAPGQQ